jgi:hypothetical protein
MARLVDQDQEREPRDRDEEVQRSPSEQIVVDGREKRYAFAFEMTQKCV